MDARYLGIGAARDRGAAGRSGRRRGQSRQRAAGGAIGACVAYFALRQADSLEDLLTRTVEDYKHSLEITQNQYNAGTAAKSDVITAQAQVLNAQAQLIAAGVTRAQSEHAIAVLMGRPPAGLSIPHGALADGSSLHSRAPAFVPPRAEAGRRGGGRDDAAGQRRDRRSLRRLFPDRLALRTVRLLGRSVHGGVRPLQPHLVVRRVARPASVQRRTHRRAGRGGARNLSRRRGDLSPDGADGNPAGRGQSRGNPHPGARGQGPGGGCAHFKAGHADRAQRISRPAPKPYTAVVTAEQQQLAVEEALLSTQAQIQTDAVDLIVALGGGWSQSKLPDAAADSSLPPAPQPPLQ